MIHCFTTRRPGGFRCLEFPPAIDSAERNAIVWLHGSGERGTDLQAVAKYGLPAALSTGRAAVTARVLCPQLEAGAEWEPKRLAALMTSLRSSHDRLALIGFSLGAAGVFDLLGQVGPQADIHVAIAMRTRGSPVVSQRSTRLLVLAGENDPWPAAGEFIRRLRGLGAVVDEVVLPGEGHFISESALHHPKFADAFSELGIRFDWTRHSADPALHAGGAQSTSAGYGSCSPGNSFREK